MHGWMCLDMRVLRLPPFFRACTSNVYTQSLTFTCFSCPQDFTTYYEKVAKLQTQLAREGRIKSASHGAQIPVGACLCCVVCSLCLVSFDADLGRGGGSFS